MLPLNHSKSVVQPFLIPAKEDQHLSTLWTLRGLQCEQPSDDANVILAWPPLSLSHHSRLCIGALFWHHQLLSLY